jgi:hypothetical protein
LKIEDVGNNRTCKESHERREWHCFRETQFFGHSSDKGTVEMTTLNWREIVASDKAMEYRFTS